MSNSLLAKLMAAKSDKERSWIVTESLLESLPNDLATALWAVAIPHWFDAKVLAALCPELTNQAQELYRQLQELSCVEVFAERGHNVHELTRNQLLDYLWENDSKSFCTFSVKAAAYFAKKDEPEAQVEWIYHLVVANSDLGLKILIELSNAWLKSFPRSHLVSLLNNLQEQVRYNRTTPSIARIVGKVLDSLSKKNKETSEIDRLTTDNSQVKEIDSHSKTSKKIGKAANKKEAKQQVFFVVFSDLIWSGLTLLGVKSMLNEASTVAMIIQIGVIYGVKVNETRARDIYATIISPLIERESLFGAAFIPGVGASIQSPTTALAIRFANLLSVYFNEHSDLPE